MPAAESGERSAGKPHYRRESCMIRAAPVTMKPELRAGIEPCLQNKMSFLCRDFALRRQVMISGIRYSSLYMR